MALKPKIGHFYRTDKGKCFYLIDKKEDKIGSIYKMFFKNNNEENPIIQWRYPYSEESDGKIIEEVIIADEIKFSLLNVIIQTMGERFDDAIKDLKRVETVTKLALINNKVL